LRTRTSSDTQRLTPLGERAVAPEPDSPDEDGALLARIVAGDQQAFAALFHRHGPQALGLALRICNNGAVAEDAVQEAFLSIWQQAGRFDAKRGSVAAYIFSAVHNKAVDAVRHEVSLRRRDETHADPATETASDEVVEATWMGVRRSEVRSAVAGLSPVQREALDLAYFGGLTYSEVAKRLRIPLGTAKTRLRDGIIQLRRLLAHLQDAHLQDSP
jgi:RNA polymerase sigma-70 factor (ECF subfamily)